MKTYKVAIQTGSISHVFFVEGVDFEKAMIAVKTYCGSHNIDFSSISRIVLGVE